MRKILAILMLLLWGIGEHFLGLNNNYEYDEDTFIFIGEYTSDLVESENVVLTSYDEYKKIFNSDKLTEEDFENNNYVVLETAFNPLSDRNITPVSYELKVNNLEVEIAVDTECEEGEVNYNYYLFKADKSLSMVQVEINYTLNFINFYDSNCTTYDKPLIYLYPDADMEVTVKLGNPNKLTTTYPKYNGGWEVLARRDGTLKDLKTNREIYGLYWEGIGTAKEVSEEGFVIKGDDTIEFLEDKLRILGLSDREANEFIIYWLPKLEHNKYNYIRFETLEEINEYMPLDINPKPDSLIRVIMDYKPLDKEIKVKEQKLITPKREGFTVVEWGGSLIN